MFITVASFKGGVGKTTTAVHLAAYFSKKATTMLVDGDPNRSATEWARAGGFPFTVVDEREAVLKSRDFDHVVVDTEARPEKEDLEFLAKGCDLLIIPSTPDALALNALKLTIKELKSLKAAKFKILLTVIPPKPSTDGEQARSMIVEAGLPIFKTGIRRYTAYKKAALEGVPVYEVKDHKAKQAWRDYQSVGREILQ